ncbi:MAG: hypothetical protein IKQ71_00350 [Lachnospiraceae bacterium]|nr:hypothetical protein [Lachnospiraceae bacterium]
MKEVEEIDVKPIKLHGVITKNYLTKLIGPFSAVRDVFGENAEQLNDLAVMIPGIAFAESKVQSLDEPLEDKVVENASKSVAELLAVIDKDIKNDKHPVNSYIHRTKVLLRNHLNKIISGDLDLIAEESDLGTMYSNGTFNNFPLPLFKDGKDTKDKEIFQRDEDRYERYMAQTPFVEQYEDRLAFENRYMIPYLKAKKAGTLTEAQETEYKLATYDHLKRQKEYFEKIVALPADGETKNIYPFGRDGGQGYKDWTGPRYGGNRLDQINREIKALEHGWSPDDFQFLHDVALLDKSIGVRTDEEMPAVEKKDMKNRCDTIMNSYVNTMEDRKRLMDLAAPIYEYNKVSAVKVYQSIEKSREVKSFVTPLTADERKKHEMAKSLKKFLKQLNTGHRVGSHTDTDEMRELKNKAKEVIELLQNNPEKDLYADPRFKKAIGELSEIAHTYTKKKSGKYEKEVRAKLTDPDVKPGTKEWRDQEREIFKELKKFKPGTKMGQTRYEAANDIIATCGEYVKNIDQTNKDREKWPEITEKGFKIARMDDMAAGSVRPFDQGVKEILNYYSKTPAFIPYHLKKKMITADSLEKTCKPLECNGISEEDFAIVAYAAVQDVNEIPDRLADEMVETKHPDITKYDKMKQMRTMYTVDIQNIHRENCINHYGEKIIAPARERAKSALYQYKLGDKRALVDMLATGIKEINYEAMHCDKMTERTGNYSVFTELLDKTLKFAKKDPEVYKAVTEKLGPEEMKFVNDTMTLKGFLNKCVDAENKLKGAARNKTPLSKAEKQQCIKDIVRYDFISSMHDQYRTEQIDNNKELNAFMKNYGELTAGIMTGKIKDMTDQDLINIQTKLHNQGLTPIPQIHGRLRTEAGTAKTEKIVDNLCKNISAGASEKDIIKSLRGFKKSVGDHLNKQYNKQKEQRKAAERKVAEQREALKNKTVKATGPKVG